MKEFIIQYWLEELFGVIVIIFGFLIKRIFSKLKAQKIKNDAVQLGVLSLLRAELIRSGEKYLERECIPVYAKDAYDKAYEAYHELGGNGTMTELHTQVMKLSTTERTNTNEKI